MYSVLPQNARIDFLEEKSRFIGIGHPCPSLARFKELLEDVKAEYPDATHVVYAYRILENGQLLARFSDAGEPAGTAGKPVYNHLEGLDLVNTVVFVVRYFGGIKLGTGGLARAYGQATKLLLQSAPRVPYVEFTRLTLTFPYERERHVQYQIQKFGARIIEQDYADKVTLTVEVDVDHRDAFRAACDVD